MSSDNGRHPASRAQIDTSPLTELEAAENEITSSSDATRIPIYIVPMICSWTSPPTPRDLLFTCWTDRLIRQVNGQTDR